MTQPRLLSQPLIALAGLLATVVLLVVVTLWVCAPLAPASAAAAQPDGQPGVAAGLVISHTVYLPSIDRNYPPPFDARGMIAFERQAVTGGPHEVYIMYHDGSRLENLTNYPTAENGTPTWSPDGQWIAFTSGRLGNGNLAIFKIHLLTRQVRQLTDGTYSDRWPTWSPDGTRIAFMRETTTNGHPNGEIYVMNADGTGQYNLTNYEWGDDFPAWSRDGQWIAFTSERNWGGRDLWVARPSGADAHIVLRTDWLTEKYPTWGADGRIYYTFNTTNEGKEELLYRIWPDGTGREKVFPDTRKRWIASWAPDGQCMVFYSYMGGGDKEVWKWCIGWASPLNLTNNTIADEFCAWSPVP
jgi:Tol biopolymer transport system component